MSAEIKTIAVLGAGVMGHGIAQVAAQAGYQVYLRDVSTEFVEKGMKQLRANLDKGVEKGKVKPEDRDAALSRLKSGTDLKEAVAWADLVIEAIPEKMEWKKETFRELEAHVRRDTIFATNTSSLSVSEIAAATARPEKFIGMHFFNPPHIQKILEVVMGKQTSEATRQTALEVGKRMGKDCIVVKDFPGFASSRLGVTLGLEAMRMLEQGVASAEDIDKAMELGYGHPMGPLRVTDLVGLDTRLSIAEYLHRELKGEQYRPPQLLRDMVAQGKLGKKSGQGFYKW